MVQVIEVLLIITTNRNVKTLFWRTKMKKNVRTIAASQFTFGFVEFDNTKKTYVVNEVSDFDPIEVDENETFRQAIDATNVIETMEEHLFDETAPCYWIDDAIPENGKIRLRGGKYHWRNDETIDVETDDIRDQVVLPTGVSGGDIHYVIFTNGDGEDDVFEWGVFYPQSK